ncbi:MAG: inorganic diphosphatase [Bacilli bacterium]|jgi:inorganic pyrophosphatase
MNIWHDIDPKRITPELFTSVVEIPKGSKCKYELDKETGLIRLDRVLYTATFYPANYGFIPLTYAEDKDPLDVLVLCEESLVPLTLVQSKPIGVIRMVDQGFIDEKIIAVCTTDPFYKNFNEMTDLPDYVGNEIKHFFQVYKTLEGKKTSVTEIDDSKAAIEVMKKDLKFYKEYMKTKDHL